MPQDDYTITTDPSGALLQDIRALTYTNLDISYIPQYGHTYELVNENLEAQSLYFLPYTGPSSLGPQRYLTYATDIEIIKNVIVSSVLIGNGNYISYINIDGVLANIYAFKDVINYNITTGIAYNPNSKLIYAVRNNEYPTNRARPSIIVAVDLLEGTETIVSVTGITFNYLTAITFDASYNLYVVDVNNNNAAKIIFSNNYTGVGTIIANNFAGISAPYGIAVDPENNVYVSNSTSNNIVKISNTGTNSIYASGLIFPTQIQYSLADNMLYVAVYTGLYFGFGVNTPYISAISNGITTEVSQTYTFYTGYYFGIAIDPSGSVYYSSSQTANTGGNLFYMGVLTKEYVGINVAGTLPYTFLGNTRYLSIAPITSVALNYQQNALYATGYSAPWHSGFAPYYPYPYGLIWKISLSDPSYNPVIFYPTDLSSSNWSTNPYYMENPTTIALDSSYNLYVGNSVDSNILVLDTSANAAYLDVSGVVLNGPTGFVFNSLYNLYVANYSSNTICKLTFPIDYLHATGTTLPITGAIINHPTGLTIDNSNNILYIANSGLNNILSVNLTTNVATIYATIPTGTQTPVGIVYDSDRGLLYMTNPTTNKIGLIANNEGPADVNFTGVDLVSPQGIIMDISNNILYVANYGSSANPIVQVTLDISQNVIYDGRYDQLITSFDLSISFADDPSGSGMLFISTKNASTIPVVTSDNVIHQYGTIPSFDDMISGDLIDIYGASSSFLQPYFCWSHSGTFAQNESGVYASIPSNLNIPFQLSCDVSINLLNIVGDSPGNATQAKFWSVAFGKSPASGPYYYLYVSSPLAQTITKLVITAPNYFDASGTYLNIDFASNNFYPGKMAIYNSTMYCIDGSWNTLDIKVCKIDLTNPQYNLNIIASVPPQPIPINYYRHSRSAITCDSLGNVYILGDAIYRLRPPNYELEIIVSSTDVNSSQLIYTRNITYDKFDNSIYSICSPYTESGKTSIEKIYLSFLFNCTDNIHIGEYTDTLYIADVVSSAKPPIVDFSFNVYQEYIIIDPSNIPQDTSTNTSIYFINQSIIPNPTDTYYLECGTTKIADPFCNNCTYNNTKFLSGTYPTGLVYSNFSKYLYVALQNNTMSRINPLGIVQNDYISTNIGLKGPTSVVLDSSFNMYVLNVTGGFISKITLENEIISANNSYYTNINTPICLTYDYITNKYLYLLSGNVPTMIITRIDIANPANILYLPIAFGKLYDANGIVVGAPTIYEEYLYVSNTDQFNVNSIQKITLKDEIDLSNNLYNIQTEIVLNSGNPYKPYTLDYIGQYLYVSNKNLPSSITKIRVANQGLGIPASAIQPWAVNGISAPSGLTHDISGNLYVANSGTGPRNSRISKIYIDYFPFENVVLADGTCDDARIYDITTQSCVQVDYYPPPSNPCSFPIPIPFPIGSG